MDAQALVLHAQIGVVGPSGAAGVREHQNALLVVHEGLGFGEIGGTGTVLDREPVALPHDAARAAGDLGDLIGAEALHDLVERARHRRQCRQPLDHAVAALHRVAALHGLAVAEHRTGGEIALLVGERLVELCREGMREIIEDVLARRDVNGDVAPFLGRNLGETPFHQRLASRDDLDNCGVSRCEIAVDRRGQRGRLHRRDQMVEEPLLGRLEGRARRGLGLRVQRPGRGGDIGRLKRCGQIVVNDLERPGIGVVDADLLRSEGMLDQLVLDALIRQRARGVEAKRLQIAREHFHRRDPARLDRLDELGARREREIRSAPKPQALGIGEIVDGGRPGRRHIEDAGVRQRVLQPQPGAALLRGCLVAALGFLAGGVGERVGFVEDDHAVEIATEPIEDLAHPRLLAFAAFAAQRGVGGEEDALGEANWRPQPEAGERRDQQPLLPERRPVTLGVVKQFVRLRHPDCTAAAFEPVVEDDARDLAALAGAGAVAEKPAAPETHGVLGLIGRGRDDIEGLVDIPRSGEETRMGLAGIDDAFELRVG